MTIPPTNPILKKKVKYWLINIKKFILTEMKAGNPCNDGSIFFNPAQKSKKYLKFYGTIYFLTKQGRVI